MVENFQEYAATLAKQLGLKGPRSASGHIGRPLPEEKLDDFEGQQIYQLYELKKSIAPIPGEDDGMSTPNSRGNDDAVKNVDRSGKR